VGPRMAQRALCRGWLAAGQLAAAPGLVRCPRELPGARWAGRAQAGNLHVVRGPQGIVRTPKLQPGEVFGLTAAAKEEVFRLPLPEAPDAAGLPEADCADDGEVDSEDAATDAQSPVQEAPASRPSAPKEPSPKKPSQKKPAPPDAGGPGGFAEQYLEGGAQDDPWGWLRKANHETARAKRRQITAMTTRAVDGRGYVLNGSKRDLSSVESMLEGTCLLSARPGEKHMAADLVGAFTRISKTGKGVLTLDAADMLRGSHRNISIVNAASTYHVGGGFNIGGRHALEEALCTQTTLHQSLAGIRREMVGDESGSTATHVPYIPVDGVVLSPDVEVFREGANRGYPFLDDPWKLGAVISVAMFNKNSDMRDAPVDAPADENLYREQVEAKFRSVLAAAVKAGSTALVICDVGCGVYKNEPDVVGSILGKVLKQEFWGQLQEVSLCGQFKFQNAVVAAAQNHAKLESLPARPSQGPPPPPRPSAGPPASGPPKLKEVLAAAARKKAQEVVWEFRDQGAASAWQALGRMQDVEEAHKDGQSDIRLVIDNQLMAIDFNTMTAQSLSTSTPVKEVRRVVQAS